MITIKRCTQVSNDILYSTFTEGFSDYLVQMSMSEQNFYTRFFGPEGNQLEHSFIAIDETNNIGIGVLLGGIRNYDGKRTMRCGALCVIPSGRGTGVV